MVILQVQNLKVCSFKHINLYLDPPKYNEPFGNYIQTPQLHTGLYFVLVHPNRVMDMVCEGKSSEGKSMQVPVIED